MVHILIKRNAPEVQIHKQKENIKTREQKQPADPLHPGDPQSRKQHIKRRELIHSQIVNTFFPCHVDTIFFHCNVPFYYLTPQPLRSHNKHLQIVLETHLLNVKYSGTETTTFLAN